MTKVYLYILGASSNPDLVECGVPWYLGDGEVFFGPCKKNIRQELRAELLRGSDHAFARERIYLVGFNALGGRVTRKVAWAGRIREAMSFGKAWASLEGDKFQEMRAHEWSPLHVRPVDGSTKPLAYEIVSKEHREESAWLQDLATNGMVSRLIVTGNVARLPEGVSWWDGFGRDVCFVLEDCFAAGRQGSGGIAIDEGLVELLRDAQPHRPKVDDVAVFGRDKTGDIYGRGHVLLTDEDDLAGRFLRWFERARPARVPTAGRVGPRNAAPPAKRRC